MAHPSLHAHMFKAFRSLFFPFSLFIVSMLSILPMACIWGAVYGDRKYSEDCVFIHIGFSSALLYMIFKFVYSIHCPTLNYGANEAEMVNRIKILKRYTAFGLFLLVGMAICNSIHFYAISSPRELDVWRRNFINYTLIYHLLLLLVEHYFYSQPVDPENFWVRDKMSSLPRPSPQPVLEERPYRYQVPKIFRGLGKGSEDQVSQV